MAGPFAERGGVALWFALSGALIAVTGAVAWMLPSVRALDAAERRAESQPEPAFEPESCPAGGG